MSVLTDMCDEVGINTYDVNQPDAHTFEELLHMVVFRVIPYTFVNGWHLLIIHLQLKNSTNAIGINVSCFSWNLI